MVRAPRVVMLSVPSNKFGRKQWPVMPINTFMISRTEVGPVKRSTPVSVGVLLMTNELLPRKGK